MLDSFYFSVVTIATVGYGDIHPTTSFGKLVAIALIIAGVGTFLEVIAGITQVMIGRRDKEIRIKKQNVIVGLFFSEMGTRLMRMFAAADPERSLLTVELSTSSDWTELQFREKARSLSNFSFDIQADKLDMERLREFVGTKGDLLLRLLENPSLLENESFTELLRAIFHLRDELLNRDKLAELPDSDKKHLSGDMVRVYGSLTSHWLTHLGYLKSYYPYLYSLAIRTNPFDNHASAVIRE